ncbi:MAG: NfeD-like protein [Symploca sp. SIO1C4]|uniref:NfeD-like protein n=1 Tax=Symploca sp. SIO1C4 TaxID=2607765 RepID=A0A6B3NMH6_9CYAN|nr:NfeD-like protein [Symploca sp. SIO1C4]
MLTIYRFCLLFGGIFVALSALAGLDGVDFDHHFDADIEITDNSALTQTGEALPSRRRLRRHWLGLPVFSFKFWSFGSCFFGLTGIMLSMLRPTMPQFIVATISVAVGSFLGTAIVRVLRSLQQNQADSLVRPSDVVGLSGIVEIPFDSMTKGKVRVKVRGSIVDFVAFTTNCQSFLQGEKVFIVEMKGNKVWVMPEDSLSNYQGKNH